MRQAQRIILAPAEGEMCDLESTIDDAALLRFRPGLASHASQTVKRIFDIAVALLLLGSLAPIGLIVSLMIMRSGGPIFFAHERVGRGGRIFKCLKFRTMVPDAAAVLEQALALDPEAREEWLRTRKLKNDPRITRIGKLLRVTSIDELPQLINVVLGDMSLVGPRPVVQQELHEHYKGDNSYYLLVRPGLTGLWQISGRNLADYEQRVHLDSCYVRNWSLWSDIVILFRTIPVVVSGHGAY
jgi:Undecaprenyl-phosphate galactose phosphotransferase WbaP